MYIVELNEGEGEEEEKSVEKHVSGVDQSAVVYNFKRVLVGAGGRALFYPTLLYNVVRNKIQSEFRWWDRVDEFILLGAVPFPTDVQRLKELGVHGVVTLNEPYETLVSTSLYHAHDIKHLVIPTRDYLFAPCYGDIRQAVDFIHNNASCGRTTYVHCKAGRGRSTTVVLCYLVEHKQMTPIVAYEYVRSIRPRVRLASSQWQAVQDYYHWLTERCICTKSSPDTKLSCSEETNFVAFDDSSMVLVSESDIEGYDINSDVACSMLTELNVACRVQLTSQAAKARLLCMWPRVHGHKFWKKKLKSSVGNDQPSSIRFNLQVC
ncbi:putative dual specificity protein phosphatase DSP8 [Heracleum sosnowskyi]|uniref:phosphatidylglycerophosphatase n=1 Tax=Heracleum sosnowskyi TaxID=360622 RepID=A0AAD8HDJ6_9APIA|nr:putative dual specificity protein phosphatase DSP8 [Heracleum sosnowskyi]